MKPTLFSLAGKRALVTGASRGIGRTITEGLSSAGAHLAIASRPADALAEAAQAIFGMTQALAIKWAPLGIRVNALAPGYFRTAMTEGFYQNREWRNACCPLKLDVR